MRFLSIAAVLLAGVSGLDVSRDKPKPGGKYDAQKCAPKVLSHTPERKTSQRLVRKGEKSNGYMPIVAFEILESGDVANAFVKRSSGFANVDNYGAIDFSIFKNTNITERVATQFRVELFNLLNRASMLSKRFSMASGSQRELDCPRSRELRTQERPCESLIPACDGNSQLRRRVRSWVTKTH